MKISDKTLMYLNIILIIVLIAFVIYGFTNPTIRTAEIPNVLR